jgi:adenine-specific DNA-methyltransferase
MEKLNLHSPDFTKANIEKLAELFPNCVTETRAADGALKKAIDFDLLKQELSMSLVEGPQERYQLNWPGKREALLTANAPIAKTLRPCRAESVDFDTTQNLYIEGDNLDALKLLQETYLGKVKMIYIDPPYNTGNDFIYHDKFNIEKNIFDFQSGVRDEEGYRLTDQEPLRQNSESNGRFHSDWLSMIYPRLKLARNLLSDDGVIFISIDDVEMLNLSKVCQEIFGEENFICNFLWKSRQTTDSRKSTKVSTDHEYILSYAKCITNFSLQGKDIDKTKYKNPDNDPRGPWASIDLSVQATKDQRPNQFYEITDPKTGHNYPANPQRVWSKCKDVVNKMIEENRIIFPSEITGRPREKKFLADLRSEQTGFSSWLNSTEVGYTTNGTRDFSDLFEERIFDFPKSVSLIKTLIYQATNNESIVLDFFSGSSTTAYALMKLNSEDNGNRRFISVQLPELTNEQSIAYKTGHKTIAEIGKERIRRAGKKIKAENADKAGIDQLDIGFRVLKVDSSNMKDVYYTPDKLMQGDLEQFTDNIRDDSTPEDLLFQVLLDWGVDLTLPITVERMKVEGERMMDEQRDENSSFRKEFQVFFVDDNALAACFDADINEAFVKELAARHPMRVVFRDAGFASDSVKINIEQIFKLISPATEIKTL